MLWGGLTYSGHPVSCAAAVANLRIYEEEKIFENVAERGRYLASRLEAMKAKYSCVGDVRYKGQQPGDGGARRAFEEQAPVCVQPF